MTPQVEPVSDDKTHGGPLLDRFGRVHTSLRVSVTDKCNLRCQYCMPDTPITFHPTAELLTFEEISQVVRLLVPRGIRKIRVTGGEPLLRRQLDRLIAMVSSIDGVDDLAITTNGILLEEQVEKLVAAGLRRINVSLDTLQSSTFKVLARRDGLERVMAGIAAATRYQELSVKLNTLILRDINLAEVLELARFAADLKIPLRFIEFMPLDAERAWSEQRMVSGTELRERLESEFGTLLQVDTTDSSQPSADYVTGDGQLFGFISTVTEPFCGGCDRLRLTADGKLRNCLFSQQEWDLREPLRAAARTDENLHSLFDACLSAKYFAHGSPQSHLQPPQRAMYQIGG
ncbi:MAG: GTP 3',8-cyclase MoaA [Planctomycetaceae bacterium]|nr:GTP 3',8-cyclase MoaA [Planctomycetaceae bacterium]